MARLIALAISLILASRSVADDWPQWRGPKRDGVSQEKGLLAKWPDAGPKLAWKFDKAGLGFSSFAIRDGKLYTLGSRGDEEIVLALDAANGAELWTAKIGPIFTYKANNWGDGPRSTPTLDGNLLFVLGGQGEFVCVDLVKNGAEVWRKNLIKDLDGVVMSDWGYTESPLVDGDRVVVTPGGKSGLMAALDKKTGAPIWRSTAVTHKAPYSSMVAAEINGTRQYIQFSYAKSSVFVNGIAANDGKLLWQSLAYDGVATYVCPTPIVADNIVYVTYSENGPGACHAFAIDKDFQPKDLYGVKEQKTLKNSLGGVVLVDGKVYGHSGSGLVCQDLKTGKTVWSERNVLDETRSAAILAADGMLYLLSQEGTVALAKATPKEFELVSEFNLPQLSAYTKTRPTSIYSKVWNHPAIANGRLYVRDCELIYCYEVK